MLIQVPVFSIHHLRNLRTIIVARSSILNFPSIVVQPQAINQYKLSTMVNVELSSAVVVILIKLIVSKE